MSSPIRHTRAGNSPDQRGIAGSRTILRCGHLQGFSTLFQLFTGWPAYPCRASTRLRRWAQVKPRASIRRLPTPCLQFAQSQPNIGGRRRSVTQVARSTVQRPDLVMYRPLQRHRLGRADRPPAGTAFIASLGAALMAGGLIAAAPPASSRPTSLRSPAMTTGSTQWSTARCSIQCRSRAAMATCGQCTAPPRRALRISCWCSPRGRSRRTWTPGPSPTR